MKNQNLNRIISELSPNQDFEILDVSHELLQVIGGVAANNYVACNSTGCNASCGSKKPK